MAHKRPGVFKGQVRGVSHQGQENTLHLKAEYIDADFPSFETFPLHSHGGPYIRQVRPHWTHPHRADEDPRRQVTARVFVCSMRMCPMRTNLPNVWSAV